ncbi:DUF2474 family protein [Ahrensia sp. R2A130]|nr:DUF2474 family protein [Ahrensia sp. R2A130]EFL89374.1 hypothetical protein R2A130_3327 [Ahrensia sp. R2A130]
MAQPRSPQTTSTARRLAWFAALWLASVVVLGVVAFIIKAWLGV